MCFYSIANTTPRDRTRNHQEQPASPANPKSAQQRDSEASTLTSLALGAGQFVHSAISFIAPDTANQLAHIGKETLLNKLDGRDNTARFSDQDIEQFPKELRNQYTIWAVDENRPEALACLLSSEASIDPQTRSDALKQAANEGKLMVFLVLLTHTTPSIRTALRDGFLLIKATLYAIHEAVCDAIDPQDIKTSR